MSRLLSFNGQRVAALVEAYDSGCTKVALFNYDTGEYLFDASVDVSLEMLKDIRFFALNEDALMCDDPLIEEISKEYVCSVSTKSNPKLRIYRLNFKKILFI